MKNIIFILFTSAFCVFICVGCDTEECEPDNVTGCVELDLKNKESIRLWCRSTRSFKAVKDAQYTVESQNTSIARVSVVGKLFTVRTLNSGKTNLIIKDNLGNETVLECNSRAFSGVWIENYYLKDIYYRNSVIVVSDDKSVAEKIRMELKLFAASREYEYDFIDGTGELTVLIPGHVPERVKGTYVWNVETQILILNYNGLMERFTCYIQPEYPNFNSVSPTFIMALEQDFTEKYAMMYPDAGIHDVHIIRYIVSREDHWQTDRENFLYYNEMENS